MARAMFDVGVLMKPNYLSIQETAELLVDFLLELGE